MPTAISPGHIWHTIHRCHQKGVLLIFARDRRSYLRWIFKAKRLDLSVLNYMGASQHIHFLLRDTGPDDQTDFRNKETI